MKENAIEIKNLCISYRGLKSYSIKKSLLHFHRNKVDEFQAIRNVSFNVPKGNILGIVGKNGSGKSTMLNAIAGIFAPDSGTIDLKGNSVSLLSIGVGFQRELTGRENIILSGMLLGFSEKAVRGILPCGNNNGICHCRAGILLYKLQYGLFRKSGSQSVSGGVSGGGLCAGTGLHHRIRKGRIENLSGSPACDRRGSAHGSTGSLHFEPRGRHRLDHDV